MPFKIHQIDHVELTVPSRFEAAKWYSQVLGLEIIDELKFWADDPNGPLMIATPSGDTKLALFRGESEGSIPGNGFHLVAFRTDAENFLSFLDELASLDLKDCKGQAVNRHSVANHKQAFSIYFCDPWQNQLEITCYENAVVRKRLGHEESN